MTCVYFPTRLIGIYRLSSYCLLVGLLTTLTLLIGLRGVIKKNWSEYRCNPIIIPLAQFFGHSPTQTFAECLSINVEETASPIMKPYDDLFGSLKSATGEIGESLGNVRGVISNVATNVRDSI
jgi:hypothetical protein